MTQHKVKLIVNPNADLGRAWQAAADLRPVVEEFGGADWSGTVYPNHAAELAYQAALDGYDLVISAGGDGTLHEVINGLMKVPADQRPKLGIVPLGSGNDFAKSFGVDPNPPLALRQIFTGTPRSIDVVRLQDNLGRVEYCDNTVGIGFDTTVTIRSRKFKRAHGFLIYFLAVIQTIILNHEAAILKIKTEDVEWIEESLLFVVCNGGMEGGGFRISPDARVDDGVLNYASISKVSRWMMFRLLPEVIKGTHGRFKQVRMGEFKQVSMLADRPLLIHTDGEIFAGFGMDVHQLTLEIIPAAIEMIGETVQPSVVASQPE